MRMTTTFKTGLAAALFSASAAAATALPPLEENQRVRSEFLAAAIGDEIRKNCPDISARFFRALGRLADLKSYARGLGYTSDDFEKVENSETAKAWLRSSRDAYLARNGVTPGDPASYCRLGREEIEKNTLTGWLLRAK